jgi:hypothetical protein
MARFLHVASFTARIQRKCRKLPLYDVQHAAVKLSNGTTSSGEEHRESVALRGASRGMAACMEFKAQEHSTGAQTTFHIRHAGCVMAVAHATAATAMALQQHSQPAYYG